MQRKAIKVLPKESRRLMKAQSLTENHRACLPIVAHGRSGTIKRMKEETHSILSGLGSRRVTEGGSCTLNVVALYDGFMTAVYAHEAVGSLTMAVRPHANVASRVWSFDMLTRLDVRHPSIRVASEADVIIVAADASAPLPHHVLSWLARSVQENGKGAPVIVAIHQEEPGTEQTIQPLLVDLRTITDRWNAPLLCNGEFDRFLDEGVTTCLANGGRASLSVIESGIPIPAPHPAGRWGINE